MFAQNPRLEIQICELCQSGDNWSPGCGWGLTGRDLWILSGKGQGWTFREETHRRENGEAWPWERILGKLSWVGSRKTKEESVSRAQCSAMWMLMRIQVTQETNCVHGRVTPGYWLSSPGNSHTRAGWEMRGRSISADGEHWRQQHLPELTSPAGQALFREFLPVTHCEYSPVPAVWKIIPHPDSSARMANCLCPVQGSKQL